MVFPVCVSIIYSPLTAVYTKQHLLNIHISSGTFSHSFMLHSCAEQTQQFVTVASFFQRKASVCSSFPSRPSAPTATTAWSVFSMVFSAWSQQNDLVGNVREKLLNLWESERNIYNPAGESVFKWNKAEGCLKTVLVIQALNIIIQRSNYWHF